MKRIAEDKKIDASDSPRKVAGKRETEEDERSEEKLDDEWPESIFHHVGSQSVSYLLSVQCEVLSRVS